ncbi:thymidine kinase [Bacillus pseudomycoides]|uniref:Thymidine kinase n=1 Tax=Bacillus pseudomycoides TaxID=64104 RepID=A0A2A8BYI0_9BACI|nr:thymidine kinase [Bacillus pseudomycoides]PEM65283.1 thymidine kinase [Bacillus pseudomycoides]
MKLTVIVGGMFSGKSSELQRQGKRHMLRGHKVLFVKPSMDDRYSNDEIVTHDGRKVTAFNVDIDKPKAVCIRVGLEGYDVVLIDEIQFFSNRMIEAIDELLEAGIRVYCAGLDMDFEGNPFGITPSLMAKADNVIKLHAVCDECGGDAWVSPKKDGGKEVVELGEKDKYFPLCRKCYYKREEKPCVIWF